VRRGGLILAVLATAGALATTVGAAVSSHVELTEAGGVKFPERAFVVSLSNGRALTAGDVQVTENGNPVVDETLVPASLVDRRTFGTVLVLDASESMLGRPIASAVAAARAFASRRNPNQQLALVTFNGSSKVALPFTTSKTKIDAALAQPPTVAYGTYIYDAVARGEALLTDAGIQAGSIVVLSDGADTGSKATAASVAAAARAHHVKLYSIGLHSPRFDPTTLRSLAQLGGGEYTLAASTKDLTPLFDQLGARLASEYLLRYKSLAGPKVQVHVSVKVADASSSSTAYQTPALPVSIPAPYKPSIGHRVWTSPIVMVLLALLGGAVAAVLAIGLLEPKRSELPGRMAEFVSVPGLQSRGRRAAASPGVPTPAGENDAAPTGFWTRLDEMLEIAQIKTSGGALVLWSVVGTAVVVILIDLIAGSLWYAALGLLTPLLVRGWVQRKLARRRNQFAEQLPDMLQVIASALRAGHSFAGALAVVVESSAEPMKSEMQRVVADEQLGIPLTKAIGVVAQRMASRDLEQVALVAELQRESGGNAAEVVDRVAETIRERFELRRLVQTLTVQGRMSRWIVSALPIALLGMIQLLNPHYMHPLVSKTIGQVMLVMAALLIVAGSLVIKKIVDIKI
jgi:tight adherence protein B